MAATNNTPNAPKNAPNAPKKAPLEKTIVNSILKWLNDQPHTRAIKTHGGAYRSGEPDIIGCVYGQMFVFEVKRPGGKTTKLQDATLEAWENAGADSFVVYSLDHAQTVHRMILDAYKELCAEAGIRVKG